MQLYLDLHICKGRNTIMRGLLNWNDSLSQNGPMGPQIRCKDNAVGQSQCPEAYRSEQGHPWGKRVKKREYNEHLVNGCYA